MIQRNCTLSVRSMSGMGRKTLNETPFSHALNPYFRYVHSFSSHSFACFLYLSFQEVKALFDTAQVRSIPVQEAVHKLFVLKSSKCKSTGSLFYNVALSQKRRSIKCL